MKSIYILAMILTTALTASCNGGGENKGKSTDGQIWNHSKPLVAKVEVSSEGALIETYEYTYDDQDRLLTLKKTDNLSKEVMLDLQYAYTGDNELRISGKFFPISTNRFINVSYSSESVASYGNGQRVGTLTYSGSWSGAWTYITYHDENGVAAGTVCEEKFASKEGYYTSDMTYSETYTVENGTITQAVAGTDIKAQSNKVTGTANTSAFKTVYTASDKADRQNFGAYLMPCTFPVWIAAGMPGNKQLIKSISGATGEVQAPGTTTIEYTLNAAGDIDTAVRTDSNAGTPYLTRTYKFIYQ
ncbi:MAG: hypothetical protein J5693_03850 [Bacteroidales bacterium]|nr:hypothetical protein [Bacteroidales bacterium]